MFSPAILYGRIGNNPVIKMTELYFDEFSRVVFSLRFFSVKMIFFGIRFYIKNRT